MTTIDMFLKVGLCKDPPCVVFYDRTGRPVVHIHADTVLHSIKKTLKFIDDYCEEYETLKRGTESDKK